MRVKTKVFGRYACAVSLASVALAAVGCGGSDSDTGARSTTGSGTTEASGPAPKGDPIKIGLVTPGAGSPGFATPTIVAADKAAVAALNKRGGLDGRPVELVYCNDKSDPNLTSQCGQKMADEKVVMVAGGNLVNGPVLTKSLAKNKIPQVGINAISGEELNNPNVYLLAASAPGWVASIGYVKSINKKFNYVGVDLPAASAFRDSLTTAAKSIGFPPVGNVLVQPSATDFQSYAAQAASKGAQSSLALFGQPMLNQFLSAVPSAAIPDHTFIVGYEFNPTLAKQAGGNQVVDQLVTYSPFPSLNTDNALVKQFVVEMKNAFEAGDKDADPTTADSPTFGAWLSIHALERMAKDGGVKEWTSAGVKKAFDSAKNIDMGGVIDPWTPNKAGPEGLARVSNNKFYLWSYKDAVAVPITKQPITPEDALAGKFGTS